MRRFERFRLSGGEPCPGAACALRSDSNLNDQFAVLLQVSVRSEEVQRLADSLSDQQTVEWVGVEERQVSNKDGMPGKHR
jgi:hypothetical protein